MVLEIIVVAIVAVAVHTVAVTWRRTHRACPWLRATRGIIYRAMLERVAKCRQNVTKGSKRTDTYPACHKWDTEVDPKLERRLCEMEEDWRSST